MASLVKLRYYLAMKHTQRALTILISLCLFSIPLGAQDSSPKPVFGMSEINIFSLGLYGGLGNLKLIGQAPSRLILGLAGGYLKDYYTQGADGQEIDPDSPDFSKLRGFYCWQARARLGFDLGILASPDDKEAMLKAELYLKSDFQANLGQGADTPSYIFSSDDPNRLGFLANSVYLGLRLSDVDFDQKRFVINGQEGSISAEWFPRGMLNSEFGSCDFLRLNANIWAYRPIYQANGLCVYLADRFIADALFGQDVPYYALTKTGGWALEPYPYAMDGCIRGIDKGRYESKLKIINSFDVRLTLPEIFGPLCVPELMAYFDTAALDRGDYQLRYGGSGLYCAGAGLYFNFTIPKLLFFKDFPVVFAYAPSYNFSESRFSWLNFGFLSRYSF